MRRALLLAIRSYRLVLSPLLAALGCRCRFHPTCSEYAIEAFRRYSAGKALYRVAARLLKCGPWHAGGIDPA